MAAGLLRWRLSQVGLNQDIEVTSAGTWGLDSSPASAHAVKVMEEQRVDITDHRVSPVGRTETEGADLILVMEERHRGILFNAQLHCRCTAEARCRC
jgi:protein-tyrosine-phosphatase